MNFLGSTLGNMKCRTVGCWFIGVVLMFFAAGSKAQEAKPAVAARRPAILFSHAWGNGAWFGNVDYVYLKELKNRGFEVDFSNDLKDLTWEHISK